jgi:homoserine kinase
MEVEGEGAAGLPRDGTNLVVRGLDLAFKEAGYAVTPPLHYKLVNRIPVGGGLGSSSAAIVAGLLAGLALTGHAVAVENEEKALQLAATVEGHVDNLAPCIYGGLQIGVHTGQRWYTTAVSVPTGLQCILFIPDKRQDTEGARAILPKEVKRTDAGEFFGSFGWEGMGRGRAENGHA